MKSKTASQGRVTVSVQAPLGELSTLGISDLSSVPAPHRWRTVAVLSFWFLFLAASIGTGILVIESDLSAIPVKFAGFDAFVTIYPPLIFCTLLLFWMGFLWAFVPAYLATFLIAVYSSMPVGWAALFAFSDTVGLVFLAIAYRSTGMGFDFRNITTVGFFVLASFVASLAGATGSFIWSHTQGLSAMETFAVWEGWWLGGFLQSVLICGPVLFLFTPAVTRLKFRWFGNAVRHERGALMLTIAVILAVLLICAFALGNAYLSRLRLVSQVAEGYSADQVMAFANSALVNLATISVLLIVASGLGFLGLTARWNKELRREVRVRTRLLEQSRKRVSAIINLVPHMIFAREAGGDFVFANRATARTLGQSASELRDTESISLPDVSEQLDRLAEKDAQVFAGSGDSTDSTEVLRDATGEERKLRISRVLLEMDDANSPAVLSVAVDVTDQERAEARLTALVAELADKNLELERFTYTVSHDLKSPIITIRGFAREMARQLEAGTPEELREDLARIEKASARMQKLLDGLLVLSRSGKLSGPKQRVNMNRMVAEVIEIMQGQISETKAKIRVAEELPDVSGDPVRLFELVQNLLENALKFNAKGTAPEVIIGCEHIDAENRYFIEDNGVGIDPDDRERIFGLFEQVGQSDKGTGIGLSLARRILQVHGGTIWVEPARELGGARFVFVLPAAASAPIA
ncbi:MAG: PAS domain S-box protein [Gammaproteobacteria bacterium]|nr:PAS domain S-box protein [Gammaproteobacteria bacterium]